MTKHIPTIAIVVNKYGDPVEFAERDVELCDNFQKVQIGTNLVSREHVDALLAKVDELLELAATANQNCLVTAEYLRKHRPELGNIAVDWCKNIDLKLKEVSDEN